MIHIQPRTTTTTATTTNKKKYWIPLNGIQINTPRIGQRHFSVQVTVQRSISNNNSLWLPKSKSFWTSLDSHTRFTSEYCVRSKSKQHFETNIHIFSSFFKEKSKKSVTKLKCRELLYFCKIKFPFCFCCCFALTKEKTEKKESKTKYFNSNWIKFFFFPWIQMRLSSFNQHQFRLWRKYVISFQPLFVTSKFCSV